MLRAPVSQFPDNEAGVASLDWKTGEPNAKYWAVRMIATQLGTQSKALYRTSAHYTHSRKGSDDLLYALGMRVATDIEVQGTASNANGQAVVLLVSKSASPLTVHVDGADSAIATVIEGIGDEPGFTPPHSSTITRGVLTLGPYGIALLELPPGSASQAHSRRHT